MSQIFHNLKLGIDEELEERLQWLVPDYSSFHIMRKSVDARRRHDPHFVYSLEVFAKGEAPKLKSFDVEPVSYNGPPVLIVGAGPAGLFAAVRLVERNIPCIILEQGGSTKERVISIGRFWRHGEFDPQNNVCYGEGGAGLFSDGKLITRIKSPHIDYVMDRLIQFGAPEEIRYLANPHVGSDKIRRVIPKIREFIHNKCGQVRLNTKVKKFIFKSNCIAGVELEGGEVIHSPHVILACGHSADDIIQELHKNDVFMEGKSYALGLRIEHPQQLIDQIQYRDAAGHPKLKAANYRLTYHNKKQDYGVYSFCMCPGGYVLSSGTEADGVVCNGMSNYNRNSPFANSAVVVTIDHNKSFGDDLFGGMKLRRSLEQKAFQMVQQAGGSKELPAQTLNDFFDQKKSTELPKSSCPSGVIPARLDELFSPEVRDHLYEGIKSFENKMKGFNGENAVLHGVESRTSCPIRITRDPDSLESVSHQGLFPTGEGAGYAGGITSAACDGIRVAEAITAKVSSLNTHQ